ncbi:MAG: quinone oxidoreductase [Acidobacteria bacterium 13_1_40CM_2_56_5]|nr:MAG: quinone oxidoreductase [Acidobacteria bacterium 13_1_40CM_2_56_5]
MKAIRVHDFGGPEVLKIQQMPDPKPEGGQVLVRIKAAGVNPVDTYIRAGVYARKPSLPYTPGTDAGGVVEAVGAEVKRVKVGDRVYTNGTITGTYAELTLAEESRVHPLPPKISFAQGAALGVPYGTAFRALFQRTYAKPGETILVHGASGGVGTACVQFGRASGLTVIGTAGTDKGRALVKQEGAHHVVNHREQDHTDQIMAITEGRGVDVIVEMLANVNLAKDLTMLAQGGRVVVVGNRGTIEINPRDAMIREASILGLILWAATDAELASSHAGIVAGLENGTLRPIVGRELPLAEAPQAHKLVLEPGSYGKIVLIP